MKEKRYKTGIPGIIPPDSSELLPDPIIIEKDPKQPAPENDYPHTMKTTSKGKQKTYYNRTKHKGTKTLLHKGEYPSKK